MSALGRRAGVAYPVIAAVLVALGYRAWYAHELLAAPEFLEPILDGAAHLEWARAWLAGTWPGPEPFFRAPGYVFALGTWLRVLGDDPRSVALAQLYLGAVTPGMVAWLAGRLGSPLAAWTAGLGTAMYPTLVFFDAQLLVPALAVPLGLLAVILSVWAVESRRPGPAVAAALAWSLAAIVRPPLLLPAFAFVVFFAGRRWRPALLMTLLVMMLPGVVTLRNAAVGDPVFIASQGGLNLHLGNGPQADGVSATFPEAPGAVGYRMLPAAAQIAERDRGESLRPSQVSSYWSRRTMGEIAAHPGRWAALMLKKSWLFFSAREIPNNHDPALFAEFLPPLRLPGWGVWFPLALVGAWSWRRRVGARFVMCAAGLVAVGAVLFFVNARFRMPMVPWMMVLAGGGVAAVVDAVRQRAWQRLGVAGAWAMVAAAVAHANPYGIPREPWPTSYVLVAEAERNRNELVRSLRWVERALERDPGLYAARVAQVDLLRRMSRLPEAEAALEMALAVQPKDAGLLHQKAIVQDLAGRPADGLATLERVLALEPAFPGLEIDRAVMLARVGRTEEAERVLREVSQRPDRANADRAARVLLEVQAGRISVVPPQAPAAR